VVLRELSWFSFRSALWAVWHRVNLRPIVEHFRTVLLQTGTPLPGIAAPAQQADADTDTDAPAYAD
jgi:hypothetical protein